MKLYFYNTLSGEKEEFTSIIDGVVKMYNCGPTVYNKATIGNLRAYVFANILRRTLIYNGYEVKQVMNITDVGHLTSDADDGEDKLEKEAQKSGESAQDIAKRITKEFLDDLNDLNIDTSVIQMPRATNYITEQILMIQTLEEKGYTYKTSDGIYFDTSLFKDYGKLGNIDIKGLQEGARVEKNDEKKNITDFALWKFSPKETKRQQEWGSPWGVGFPGWHIECSAMSRALLGAQIDIHTGGIDHIPIHHNNEIAQSECSSGKQFVRFWMHGAFINIDNKRIGKSVGNVIYLSDIKDKGISPIAYRYLLLTGHYRTQMNFTWESLNAAQTALNKLYSFVSEHKDTISEDVDIDEVYKEKFHAYINDDLDTPKAIATMWSMLKDDEISDSAKVATLLHFDSILGLKLQDVAQGARLNVKGDSDELELPKEVEELLQERKKARENKDYKLSDELRAKLAKLGYRVKDTSSGQEIKLSTR